MSLKSLSNDYLFIQGGCLFDILAKGVEAYMGEGTYYYITLLLIDAYSRKYGTGKKKYIRYFLPLEIKYCEGMLKPLKKITSPLLK